MKGNAITIKALRSLAGTVMSIASLLVVWTRFLAQFWAALSQTNTKAPHGCVWTRQIFTALCWIHLFLTEAAGTISRNFLWSRFYDTDHSVVITTDASPYGIGGFVSVNGVVTEYFADHICPSDCRILQQEHGSHEGQQAFEALALLLAFRLWKQLLLHSRACITVQCRQRGSFDRDCGRQGQRALSRDHCP